MPTTIAAEGLNVPDGLPAVIDAHVHIFPHSIFALIWKWFEQLAWSIRYRMPSSRVFDFLLSRGIKYIIALQYAHKPGIARRLNRYMLQQCSRFPNQVVGLATVFPGEKDAQRIQQEAFDQGLGGGEAARPRAML